MGDAKPENPPIRVCHILPALPLHGAENLLLTLCRHMDPREVHISILLISEGGPLVPDFEALGIPVTLIPKKGRYDVSILWKIRRFLKSGRFDVVHSHLFTASFWGRLGALGLPSALISSAHNIVSEKGTVLQRIQCLLDRNLTRFTDAVLCVTPQVKRSMRQDAGLSREKLVTIDNGIEFSESLETPTVANAREMLGIPSDARVVGVIGRFSVQKNHRVFLESLPSVRERVPGLTVLLVGEGELEGEIRDAVAVLGLEGTVRFLGLRRDIPLVLKALDVLVIPSLWEGLPIVLLEAMTSGTPVIAARVGGIPDVLTDRATGLLAEPDASSLSENLSWALENPGDMERMARAAVVLSRERYDIRQTAKRYLDLYRSVFRERSFHRGLRDTARSAVGTALSRGRSGKTLGSSLRVLMYHRIARDMTNDILSVDPFAFREQMNWLKEEGFRILDARSALKKLRAGTLEPDSVVITFDDGYRDNYEEAFPVLERERIPATIFPVTGFVRGEAVHPRYMNRVSEVTYLTSGQIREMKRHNIDFGCHTHTHPLMTTLSDEEIRGQIRESKKLLEDWTGETVLHFAYPNGAYLPGHFRILEETGFEAAFTVRPGANRVPESRWTLRRTEISGRDTLSHFAAKLRGGFDLWHGIYQSVKRSGYDGG